MSLTEMIFGREQPARGPILRWQDFTWKRLPEMASFIRDEHNKRTKVRDVTFDAFPAENKSGKWEDRLWYYQDCPKEYLECWQYDDGCVLVALLASVFAGTFAEHDETEVLYYLATPKN